MGVTDKLSYLFSENNEFLSRGKLLYRTLLFICLPQLPVALGLDFQLILAASADML